MREAGDGGPLTLLSFNSSNHQVRPHDPHLWADQSRSIPATGSPDEFVSEIIAPKCGHKRGTKSKNRDNRT